MRVDGRRAARGVVLAVWAGFLVWLRLSGEVTRYLGPRTYWVVTFGAVALAIGALAHFATLRTAAPESPIGAREGCGLLLLLVPILAVVVVPGADLGALAASKKTAAGGLASVSSVIPEADADREVQFIDIHYANESDSYAGAMGITDGLEVELTGFVTHPENTPEGWFALTRFYVSCCAADAIPYSVTVQGASDFPDDTWLKLVGTIGESDRGFFVVASRIERIDALKDPYLY